MLPKLLLVHESLTNNASDNYPKTEKQVTYMCFGHYLYGPLDEVWLFD